MLGLLVGTRRMYIGVPLLLGLNNGELRAVLCHELGHYAGRHTRMGALTYRGAVALELVVDRLRLTAAGSRNGFATLLLLFITGYARLYRRISFAVRRRQEIEADADAAAVVGKQFTIAALRRVHELTVAWNHFLADYLVPVQRKGFVPVDLFLVFDDLLRDPWYRDLLAAVQGPDPTRRAARWDTHPPLAERLRMLDALEDRPVPTAERDLAPAIDLLAGERTLLPSVQETLFRDAGQQPETLPWQEWADLAAAVTATAPALVLLRAAGRIGGTTQPTLNTVLELLEHGSGSLLAKTLAEGAQPGQEAPQLLRTALFALVGQALVADGDARWRLSWTGPGVLVAEESRLLRVHDLVDAAVSTPVQLRPVYLELTLLGVRPDAPVAMPGRPDRASDDTLPTGARRSTTIAPAKRDERQARELKAVLAATLVFYAAIGFVAGVLTPTLNPDPVLAGRLPKVTPGVPLPAVVPSPWGRLPALPLPSFSLHYNPPLSLPSVLGFSTVTVGPGTR
ncbi:M48 family metalloprotease [Streptacidiphilus sp. 4-A2]|nr:M48 family metalloprotease [Streptacidiphilus sp. 4-A2]